MEVRKALSAAIVVTMFAASAVGAYAKSPTVYRLSKDGAAAYYSGTDETGCVSINSFVEFGESARRSRADLTQQPTMLYMYIMSEDTCSGLYTSIQTNPPALLPEGAVKLSPSLQSASLHATVELVDDSGHTFTADVSVTWTAMGTFQRTNIHDHNKAEGGIYIANTRSLSRDATASGSVIVNGVDLTQSPGWGQAWIEREIDGAIQILKNR